MLYSILWIVLSKKSVLIENRFPALLCLFLERERIYHHEYDHYGIPDNEVTLEHICLCEPFSEHRPEKYERYEIGMIAILIVERQETREPEYPDSPVYFGNISSCKTAIEEPYRDIRDCGNIDPSYEELDTRSYEPWIFSCEMKRIFQCTEEYEHNDERNTDPVIWPGYEPESRNRYCERQRNNRFFRDPCSFFSFGECDHETYDDPRKVDEWPYRKSKWSRSNRRGIHIRNILLTHPAKRRSKERCARPCRKCYHNERNEKNQVPHREK